MKKLMCILLTVVFLVSNINICPADDANAEDLKDRFASFYNPVEFSKEGRIEGYGLPLDISQVENYASVSDRLGLGAAEGLIRTNGFAVMPWGENEDDIVEVYNDLKDMDIPIFITSDSLLHLYHIQFDETLKDIEEREFYGDIVELTQNLLAESERQYNMFTGDLKEAAKRNVAFFSVALRVLCRDINEPVEEKKEQKKKGGFLGFLTGNSGSEYGAESLIAVDFNSSIPVYVKELVDQEVQYIEAHQGFKKSPIFIYKEDYSQYVPRGHYTRSEVLKRYFKGMMWYGRMSFLLKGSGNWGPYSFQGALISLEDANIQTIQAILIARAICSGMADERKLIDIWDRIYTVTAFYVGFSDDLSIYEYRDEINNIFHEGLEGFDLLELNNIDKIFDLREKLAVLRSPEIYGGTGNCIIYKPGADVSPEDLDKILDKTKGMRLMGQRFIPDSYIMQNLVFPVVGEFKGKDRCFTTVVSQANRLRRGFPRGLDVMGILGSERAREILDATGDSNYERYDESFNKLKGEFEEFTEEDWNKNLYWSWLYALKALLKKEGPGYQTFMRTNAWTDKQLNACLASWAELRHDTILYAKQSYTPIEETSMQIPKRVVGYVEPVPEFYARLITLTDMTLRGLDSMNVLDDAAKNRIEGLKGILERLLAISEKELANQELTEDDYNFIKNFGDHLEAVVLGVSDKGTSTVLVADVHTECNTEIVLEEGVGYVKILAACYMLPDGRVLIGAGPTLSYYEFKEPMANRLTDEAWKAKLEEGTTPSPLEWNNSFDLEAYNEYGPAEPEQIEPIKPIMPVQSPPSPPTSSSTAEIAITNGWNLIAIPVIPDEPCTVRGFIEMVESDPCFEWNVRVVAVYKNGRFERYPKEGITHNMVPGKAYFVYANYGGQICEHKHMEKLYRVIHIAGEVPDSPVVLNLNRGWNGVSLTDFTHDGDPVSIGSLCSLSRELQDQGIKATKIAFWDNTSQGWKEHELPFRPNEPTSGWWTVFPGFPDPPINPNEGFFLLCEENGLYIPGLEAEADTVNPPLPEPVPGKDVMIQEAKDDLCEKLDIQEEEIEDAYCISTGTNILSSENPPLHSENTFKMGLVYAEKTHVYDGLCDIHFPENVPDVVGYILENVITITVEYKGQRNVEYDKAGNLILEPYEPGI